MSRTARFLGLPIAAALLLASAAPAAAAGVTETLTVNGAVTITGLPTSIAFGAVDPGVTTGSQALGGTVSANVPWTLFLSASPLGNGAGGTIPATNQDFNFPASSGATLVPPADTWTAWSSSWNSSGVASGGAGTFAMGMSTRVRVPVAMPSGSYTGTLTITVSAV